MGKFTGVTPAVVFDNDVAAIVIRYAAVVIFNDAAVAVVNVVNAHAVAAVKYSSFIYNFAAVIIKAPFAIAHSSVIAFISVAAVATGNGAVVANVEFSCSYLFVCFVLFCFDCGLTSR